MIKVLEKDFEETVKIYSSFSDQQKASNQNLLFYQIAIYEFTLIQNIWYLIRQKTENHIMGIYSR